jgi:PEGA domain
MVSIDGQSAGASPVRKLVSEGAHTYSVHCARGGIWTRDFSVAAGKIRTYSVSCPTPLRPIAEGTVETREPRGNFALDTSPPGLRVVIDGKYRGTSPLRMGLSPGRHKLAIRCPGVKVPADLDIQKGIIRDYVLTCNGQSRTAALGDILIETQPAGLKLTIDGAPRGPSPAEVTLSSGRHTYIVECPNDDRYTKSLAVPPNGKKDYNIVCTTE